MNVDLGGGITTFAGRPSGDWVNLDVNPAAADVIGSADRLPFARASIDSLRAVDVLEHLSYRDTDIVLAEWARVVRPGGRLFVQVPDADLIMQWYVRMPHKLVDRLPGTLPPTPLAGAAWRLLGGHSDGVYARAGDDWRWNAHYALFSQESLCEHLDLTGWRMESITVNPHPNIQCWATRR